MTSISSVVFETPEPEADSSAGVSDDGSGSHRLIIISDGVTGTDPDGFVWKAATESSDTPS